MSKIIKRKNLSDFAFLLVIEEQTITGDTTEGYLLSADKTQAIQEMKKMHDLEFKFEKENGNLDEQQSEWYDQYSMGWIYCKNCRKALYALRTASQIYDPDFNVITEYRQDIRVNALRNRIPYEDLLETEKTQEMSLGAKASYMKLMDFLLRDLPEDEKRNEGVSLLGLLTLIARGAVSAETAYEALQKSSAATFGPDSR